MEFHYYGSFNDNIRIVNSILKETQLKVIPDKSYSERKVELLTEMTPDLEDLIKKRYRIYFWNENLYETFPLEYQHIKERDIYCIHPSPSVTTTFPSCIENNESEKQRCICGILSHSKQIYDSNSGEIIPIQKNVILAYKDVLRIVKMNSVRVKNKSLWIGKEAYNLFKADSLEVIHNGEWVCFSSL